MWKSIFEGAQKKIKCTHKQCHGGRGHDRDEEMGGNHDHESDGLLLFPFVVKPSPFI